MIGAYLLPSNVVLVQVFQGVGQLITPVQNAGDLLGQRYAAGKYRHRVWRDQIVPILVAVRLFYKIVANEQPGMVKAQSRYLGCRRYFGRSPVLL
jgi:hypothetical protein